jgi:hypothetical protein
MARKRITALDPLFIRMLLNANEGDFALRVTEVLRTEKVSDIGQGVSRFKRFWKENKDKFDIEFSIKLKDEYIEQYEKAIDLYDIGEDELLGDYLERKQKIRDEEQRKYLQKLKAQQAEAEAKLKEQN